MDKEKKQKKMWDTKEWKEAKKKKLKDKCKWCGFTEALVLHHDPSWREIVFFKLRELVIPKMCEEKGATFYPSALRSRTGFQSSKRDIKVREIADYIKDHPELKEEARELAKKEYLSLSNTITLCKRCHAAAENGLVLCEYCKKKYFNPKKHNACFNCKEKAEEEIAKGIQEIEEKEDKYEKEMDKAEFKEDDELESEASKRKIRLNRIKI